MNELGTRQMRFGCLSLASRPARQMIASDVFDTYFGRGMDGTVHTILAILEDRLAFRA